MDFNVIKRAWIIVYYYNCVHDIDNYENGMMYC